MQTTQGDYSGRRCTRGVGAHCRYNTWPGSSHNYTLVVADADPSEALRWGVAGAGVSVCYDSTLFTCLPCYHICPPSPFPAPLPVSI
jgi:hypothetical protein